jgi:hypothetical protein
VQHYYFAGGMESPTEHTTLALLNGGRQRASVRLTFLFGTGAPDTKLVHVAPASALRVAVAHIERRHGPFGLVVTAGSAVTPQLTLTRNQRDGDSLPGSRQLATRWYLAEGSTERTFHETVAILNPDGRARARVLLRLLPVGGRGGREVRLTVPAHTHRVVDINRLLPGRALSIIATADRPIAVERTLTFSRDRHGRGYGLTASLGATASAPRWLFAAGATTSHVQTFLTILNPGAQAARVTARVDGQPGGAPGSRTFVVPAGSRSTIRLNASEVTSTRPVVVERVQYSGTPTSRGVAGADVVGRTAARTQWSFPGGNTAGGNRELLPLYNPASRTIAVQATFYGADGRILRRTIAVPARGRATIDVSATIGRFAPLHGVVLQGLRGQGFVAEQTIVARATLSSTQGLPLP